MAAASLRYKRVLIKLSGEALMGAQQHGIEPGYVRRVASELAELSAAGCQIVLVIGGGNICRGTDLAGMGIERGCGDHMGMLATVINGLALQSALEHAGVICRLMSAIQIDSVCEPYILRRATQHLKNGRMVICVAGTGNPFFTTDTAASLRAAELGVELFIKATKVDGIYSEDPVHNKNAVLHKRISYSQVLEKNLRFADTTAVVMCRDNNIPMCVINLNNDGDLMRLMRDGNVGSIITNDD